MAVVKSPELRAGWKVLAPWLAIKRQVVACLRRPSLGAWLGGLGFCVLLVVLRWNSLAVPLVRDEGEYAYAAQLLKSGRLPYEHSFLQKPPLVVYTYALANALAPNTFWFPRLLAGLFAALAACLLGLIARLEFGPGFALPAAWLVTPMLLFPGLWQFTANTEMFMILPLLATVAVYVLNRHRTGSERDRPQPQHVALPEGLPASSLPLSPVWPLLRLRTAALRWLRAGSGAWFLAGALAAITLLYKYTAVPILAFLFVVWSVEEWRAGRGAGALHTTNHAPRTTANGLRTSDFAPRTFHCWLFALLGATLASLIVLGPFLARDGGRRLWECTVVFNRFYRASASFGLAGLWLWLQAFWVDWWILFLLPISLFVRRRRRVWFWTGMFGAAWVSTGASAFGQYYVVVMPFWALLVSVAINDLAAWVATLLLRPRAGTVVPAPPWLRRLLTGVVVLLVCLPDLPWVACAKQEFAAVKAGGGNPFLESQPVARRVAELTAPHDYVFVAGSEPQILYYSKRVSPTRFVIVYPLMIPTVLAEGYQREAVGDLERHPPAAIVLARSGTSWLRQERSPSGFLEYLDKLLADHYERVGGWVVDGQSGRWLEPLSDQNLAHSSLVLFRRRSL